jgi:hypothetical protein
MTNKNHAQDVWDQDWFLAMHINHQLFYLFIADKCNVAGIWRPNKTSFERNRSVRIDLEKFLIEVNQIETRITVLPGNIWFLNYHITTKFGNIYKSTYAALVTALKIAFLSGIQLEWIKGFANPENIDREYVVNSYTQRVTKFVSGIPTSTPVSDTNPQPRTPEKIEVKINGSSPGFMLPKITFLHSGDRQDEIILDWLTSYDFTKVISAYNIRSPEKFKSLIESFVTKARISAKKTGREIADWFGNWIGKQNISSVIQQPTENKDNNNGTNKFSSIQKFNRK